VRLAFETRGYELVQQKNWVPKLFEPLEVEGYLYMSLKKLAVSLRFKSQTLSGWSSLENGAFSSRFWNVRSDRTLSSETGHCPVMGFCECFLNCGLSSRDAGQCPAGCFCFGWMKKTWLGYFHFIHIPLLIVQYFYTQETWKTTSSTWACIRLIVATSLLFDFMKVTKLILLWHWLFEDVT
jgi:hypothetical protein